MPIYPSFLLYITVTTIIFIFVPIFDHISKKKIPTKKFHSNSISFQLCEFQVFSTNPERDISLQKKQEKAARIKRKLEKDGTGETKVVKKKSKKKEERKEREREREREPFGRRGEAVETPPTRFLCGPQLCCFFGPRNETLPANNPTRVLIFADDPALTGEETSWPSPSPRKKLNTTSAAKDFRLLQILSLQRTFLIHFIGFSILAQP